MELEIKELIKSLKKEIGKDEIIAIIYNPYESGMEHKDCLFLKHLFKNHKYTSPLFLLNGRGGSIRSGIWFPYLIKQSVKNYYVYIPSFCCSALCYTLLKANKLFVGENTTIT